MLDPHSEHPLDQNSRQAWGLTPYLDRDCQDSLHGRLGGVAVRRHTAAAFRAIEVARSNPTEEKRRENRAMVAASFQEAQTAWDDYRKHLIEHGVTACVGRVLT